MVNTLTTDNQPDDLHLFFFPIYSILRNCNLKSAPYCAFTGDTSGKVVKRITLNSRSDPAPSFQNNLFANPALSNLTQPCFSIVWMPSHQRFALFNIVHNGLYSKYSKLNWLY